MAIAFVSGIVGVLLTSLYYEDQMKSINERKILDMGQSISRLYEKEPAINLDAYLQGIAELALDLGLPWLNIQFLTPFGRATKYVAPDTQAAADEARRVIDRYRDRMKFQLINLPFCFMPGYEELLTGDLLKLERHMIFVNNEDVNLAEYLSERRTRKPVCESCPHSVFCGGFYEMEKAPEPKWIVNPEDLDRPLQAHPTKKIGLPVIAS